jgi:hypothetical protein
MRRLRGWRNVAVLACAAVLACTPARSGTDSTGRSPQLITESEIADANAATAYDAVMQLRANFLSDRGPTSIIDAASPREPTIYLDGMMYGPGGSLRNIPANTVATIRLYRAWEASTRFGAPDVAGVIEVVTRRR